MLKPKKSLENIDIYEVPLFEQEWDLKLDLNENLFGPSPKVLDAIRNVEESDIKFYPAYGILSQKIAEFTGFEIENIKITNGADEAISSIFQTYLEEGDRVLSVVPTFSMPFIYAKLTGAVVEEVPYKKKWSFPIDDFLNKLNDKKVRLVYLTTPNSPTGDIIPSEMILKILEKSKDKIILIDETYGNYCNSTYKELVKKYDNVLIVKSFSKDFALAGLRLGYIISNKYNIQNIKSVVSPYSVNTLAVKAGIAALDDCQYFNNIKQQVEKSKVIMTEGLQKIGAKVYPSFANFLAVDFDDKHEFVLRKLISNKIIIKRFKNGFGGFMFRVGIPRPEDAKKVFDALKLKDTIAFDMDGVLIDASKSYRLAVKETFQYFSSKEISYEKIQDAKNLGGLNNDWDLTDFLLKKEGISIDKDILIERFQQIYWNEGRGLIQNEELLIDKKLLGELSKKYNLAIFTGRPKQEAEFALKLNGIFDYFYPVITMEDIPADAQKPSPYGLKYLKKLILTDKILYFGDTKDDIISAKSADVIPVGVLPPQDKTDILKENLKQHGAIIVLDSINQINNLLEIKNEI